MIYDSLIRFSTVIIWKCWPKLIARLVLQNTLNRFIKNTIHVHIKLVVFLDAIEATSEMSKSRLFCFEIWKLMDSADSCDTNLNRFRALWRSITAFDHSMEIINMKNELLNKKIVSCCICDAIQHVIIKWTNVYVCILIKAQSLLVSSIVVISADCPYLVWPSTANYKITIIDWM